MFIKIILAAAIAWLFAQFLKFIIDGLRNRRFNSKMLVYPGKMPSGHTATVIAMTSMIFLIKGFSSLFAVALIFSIIIMYDAVTVRRQVGLINNALNRKLKSKLRYFEGHTMPQVAVGGLIGIIIAILVFLI